MLSKAFLISKHLKEKSTNRIYSYGVLVSVYLQVVRYLTGFCDTKQDQRDQDEPTIRRSGQTYNGAV